MQNFTPHKKIFASTARAFKNCDLKKKNKQTKHKTKQKAYHLCIT